MLKIVIGTVLGGIVLFGAGFVSWAVLGWHNDLFQEMPAAAVGSLKQAGAKDGVYLAPYMDMDNPTEKSEKAWTEAHKQGPRAFLVYHAGGADPMAPATYVMGLLLNLAMALVVSLLLAAAGIGSWFGRFLFVIGIGILAGLGEGMYWVWFSFPDDWAVHMAADHLLTWAVAGFFLAIVVKPEPA